MFTCQNFLQCGGGEGDASLGTEADAGRFSKFYSVYNVKISYIAGAGKVMRHWGQRQLPGDLVNFTVCIMSKFLTVRGRGR